MRDTPKAPAPGPRAYAGPIAILVDAGCASSCESTLQALQKHPRSRVFGERTGGYANFGEVGTLMLPETGIEVGIPTRYYEFEGGRIVDKVGFDPDVVVSPGTDALDVVKAWLLERLGEPRQ